LNRVLVTATLLLALPGSVCFGAPPPVKPTPKSTSAAAKRPLKRAAARRRPVTPRPAPVSPQVRQAAHSAVSEWLNQPGTIENPAALVPFLEQLVRLETGSGPQILPVLHYGDSHTASDDWSGTTRYLLQSRFGNGGPGFTHAGRPYLGYRRLDVAATSTRAWYSDGLVGRDGDGMYGLSGISMSTRRAGESVTLEADCASAELHFLRQPGGGRVEISDNGTVLETISTEGEPGPGVYSLPVQPGPHRFTARTHGGPVRLFGWVAENTRGLTYDMLGMNGAQASIGLRWEETVLAGYFHRRPPALIILAYGTNEARNRDWTFASYRDMFTQLLARFRRLAPTASLLVIGPPDHFYRSGGRLESHPKIDLIREAQRAAAGAAGAAFWDLRERTGGKGAMGRWVTAGLAQRDYVHFTADGYRLLGAALYKELMAQYATYQRVRSEALPARTASDSTVIPTAVRIINGQTNENQ
jgi:lysophospholipase L1-like esterase